jgi:DNA modification methylase
MKEIPDGSIDMILCDLPYGTTQCKWDNIIPFEPLWEQYNRIIKDNGAIVLFGTEPFSSRLRLSNLKYYKYDWIWDKVKGGGFLNANRQQLRTHELISVFYKKQCLYNPQKTQGHKLKKSLHKKEALSDLYGKVKSDWLYESTERYPVSIQTFSKDTQSSHLHPTQKPVELLKYTICTYTNEGNTVLDNCIGSGSTAIACMESNRNFIGMELDTEYFDIACKRIEQHKLKMKEEELSDKRIKNI